MNSYFRNLLLIVLSLILPGMALADSEIKFDASGRPSKLVLGGMDMRQSGSSAGFVLRYSNGREATDTRLGVISASGNKITASDADGKHNVTFEIDAYPNHLTIQLLNAQGIGTGRDYSLSLELDSTDIAAYALNDLATANFEGKKHKSTEMKIGRKNTVLSWPYLWGRPRPDGTHGSVVLYDNRLSGSARDAVLAEIWSVEGTAGRMVRPAGQATWTEADVMAWVKRWVAKFSRIAVVSVAGQNKAELYKMTDTYVIPSGANRVYIFGGVWRGEEKLNYLSNVSVNTHLFPNGKSDLMAYSEYLAKHGINLQLKSLGPQIGRNDSRYFSPTKVDHRIASWVKGTLAEAVDSSATSIRFRPGPGYIKMRSDVFFMRLGNEMVEAKKITVSNDHLWILERCQRGYGGTTAKPHTPAPIWPDISNRMVCLISRTILVDPIAWPNKCAVNTGTSSTR